MRKLKYLIGIENESQIQHKKNSNALRVIAKNGGGCYMNKGSTIMILMLLCVTISIKAQLSRHDAAKAMGRGINMGNTLEPPGGEGTWGNPAAVASNFDDYKNAGFTCARLPITWDNHMAKTSPYQIDAAWLDRIEQIVDWGLSQKLMIVINAH